VEEMENVNKKEIDYLRGPDIIGRIILIRSLINGIGGFDSG
jgi:hypothetical protein